MQLETGNDSQTLWDPRSAKPKLFICRSDGTDEKTIRRIVFLASKGNF